MNVMLVGDDLILAQSLSCILKSLGLSVSTINSSAHADTLLQRNMAAVLVLITRGAISDPLYGLDLGADGYPVKPFATPELVAGISALIQRSNQQSTQLTIGSLSLDTTSKRATINGKKADFSVREWTVLEYLMQQASRVVSKQQIIDAVLPCGDNVTLNAIEVYVSRIRAKTAGSGVSISTIRGFGYILEDAAPEFKAPVV